MVEEGGSEKLGLENSFPRHLPHSCAEAWAGIVGRLGVARAVGYIIYTGPLQLVEWLQGSWASYMMAQCSKSIRQCDIF